MDNIQEDFILECSDKIRNKLKELVCFDKIESILETIPGLKNIKKNSKTKSPLDINYEFEYGNIKYCLRAVAVNLDYSTGNYHCFPGVLQLYQRDTLCMYPDNKRITKRSKKFYKEISESSIQESTKAINEYEVPRSTVKSNNMPYIKGNIASELQFWLSREEGLQNKRYFELEKSSQSKPILQITEEFLKKRRDYKVQYGRFNCKNFFYIRDKDGNTILSPLTYNDGGIY